MEAEKDLERHKKSGNKKILLKIDKLFDELRINPQTGTGKPEKLKHYEKPTWSRRNILILIVALFGMSFFLSSCDNFPEPSPRNYELFVGARDQYPKFSPDGEKIAYYHYSDQLPEPDAYPSGLYIMDRDGSNHQLVLEGHHFNPAWSPDGEWLVFSRQGVIQKCKVNGDSLNSIAGIGYFFPDYSPDGKNLVFDRMVTEEGSLMIIDSNFIGLPQVFLPNITTGRDVEYSPDGSSFIYMKGSREWPHWG